MAESHSVCFLNLFCSTWSGPTLSLCSCSTAEHAHSSSDRTVSCEAAGQAFCFHNNAYCNKLYNKHF